VENGVRTTSFAPNANRKVQQRQHRQPSRRLKKKMSPANGKPSPGTIAPSSAERFDEHTASVPAQIGSEVEPEILPPGPPDPEPEEGWPKWDVQQIIELPFFFLGRRLGDLWKLDEEESERFARALKPVLDRYLPLKETELGTLALVALAIVGPRLLSTDWEKLKRSKAEKAKPATSTKTAGSTGSPSSPGSVAQANPAEWEPFADSRAV
jgi:hypothetical protein